MANIASPLADAYVEVIADEPGTCSGPSRVS
jgi:hypothetical protein